MRIECRRIAELPFNLNLPEGEYEIRVGTEIVLLHVLQERIAAHLGMDDQSSFLLISRAHLAAGIRGAQPVFHQRLRTVIEMVDVREVPDEQIHVPTGLEEIAELSRQLILSRTGLSGPALEVRAAAELTLMDAEAARIFRHQLGRKLTARQRLPADVPLFQKALNTLVRLYMTRFRDFFVEEVAIHQLAGMVTSGVMIVWSVDGAVVEQVAHVEKVPGMMRGQWFDHGEVAVAEFRTALRNGAVPDSVQLLSVRARAFLERGAYRSAIIEASAALETAVTRRIQSGLVAFGKSDAEITGLLKSHGRFQDRAKKLLKQATGTSAATLDATLWQQVLAHRESYRHRIAHSDLEPSGREAETAVDHFIRLAALVSAIP